MCFYVRFLCLCLVVLSVSACRENGARQTIKIGEHEFHVDYAVTPEERAKGLMFVESLEDDYAMVFLNPEVSFSKFWMKNTLIPLDMLFFDQNNMLVHIEREAVPHDLTPRGPDVPVCTIVEIKGGQADTLKIQTGMKLFTNVMQECLQ